LTKKSYQIAQDFRLPARRAKGRIAGLCNPLRNTAAGEKTSKLVTLLTEIALVQQMGQAFGGAGVLALGAISGVADLNAITLSVQMSRNALDLSLAVSAIVLGSVSNGLFKSALAWVVGGSRLGLRVALSLMASGVAGPLTVWATGNWPQL
jgi:uncharacterized membrane protein (DUF4010 family)